MRAKEGVTSAAEDAVSGAETAGDGLKSDGRTSGVNYAAGLAAGILAGKDGVVDAAKEVANAAAGNKALEVNSPSRVGRRTGMFYGKSMALGIKDMYDAVYASSKGLAGLASLPGMQATTPPKAALAGGSGGQAAHGVIDYDRLADAVSRRNVSLQVDGKELATTQASNNSVAISERGRQIMKGYGG